MTVGFTVGLLVNRIPGRGKAVPAAAGVSPQRLEEREVRETPLWFQLFQPSEPTARLMLRTALPALAAADGSAAAEENRNLAYYLTDQAEAKPQTFFQAVLPFTRPKAPPSEVVKADPGPVSPPVKETPPVSEPPKTPTAPASNPPAEQVKPVSGGVPMVGIYHTHDWESYISEFPGLTINTVDDEQKIASQDHKKRTVYEIGEALAGRLKAQGVSVVHAPWPHGFVGYDYAYTASRDTAKAILKQAPTVKVLVDLHRDAVLGVDTTIQIKEQKVAQVRCIIGKEQPHWQQNKSFCEKLMTKMEAKYPGITLPTREQNYTYNQDLLPGAILLEIGGAMDQYVEAERTTAYIAETLADLIRQGEYPK